MSDAQNPANSVVLPKWARDRYNRSHFLLRLAALYATPAGTVRQLSIALDLNPSTLSEYLSRDEPITPELAIKIEKLLGANLFPRSLLRPDHFKSGN